MRGISFTGSPGFLIIVAALAMMRFWWSGRPRMALLFVVTVLGAYLLDEVLKLGFRRARPVAFFGLKAAGYSFPSGHALVSCASYGVLAAFSAARTGSRVRRWMLRAGAALLIGMIGISRVYLGVHYPSDVLAGYAAALVWVYTVASARRWRRRGREAAGRW
jgi:undecaprenyl-diphosphatase